MTPMQGSLNLRQAMSGPIPPEVQKCLSEKNGVIFHNGKAIPLKEGPIKNEGGVYLTVKKVEVFDVFLKEDSTDGYKYNPHFKEESFKIVSDEKLNGQNGIRKISLQSKVDSTEDDYLPITFTLASEKTPRPAKFTGIFVRVGDKPPENQ